MEAPPRRSGLLAATAVLVVFLASACTGVTTDVGQDPAPVTPSVGLGALDGEVAAPAAAAPGGHTYGASLDEWSATEQQQGDGSLTVVEEREPATEGADDSATRRPGYADIAWEDLIPAGSSTAELMDLFQERLKSVELGSEEAEILYEEIQAEYNPEAVNEGLDGAKIRLAGFVAPLTYDDDIVTEFLLVPTFGACIHVPPPPPNQTVMVTTDKANGLTLDEAWGAVWVEGTMTIESGTTDIGSTSYRITDVTSGAYTGV